MTPIERKYMLDFLNEEFDTANKNSEEIKQKLENNQNKSNTRFKRG